MKNINLGKVLIGGLLAGLILNVGEFLLNDVILGAHRQAPFDDPTHQMPDTEPHAKGER